MYPLLEMGHFALAIRCPGMLYCARWVETVLQTLPRVVPAATRWDLAGIVLSSRFRVDGGNGSMVATHPRRSHTWEVR